MKRTLFWDDLESIKILNKSLDHNALSIVDTDTILGLLGRLTLESYEVLNHIKGGRSGKPYLILLGSSDKLKLFVDQAVLTAPVMRLIDYCWPGPVTFIFKAQPKLPDFITSSGQTIALRCPKHAGLQKLLNLYDGLFSTSANKSSEHVPVTSDDINPDILAQIEYLVIDRNNIREQAVPSTIIDLSGLVGHDQNSYAMIKVVRVGAYPIEELERIYGSKFKR
jgi:L-threonylcarbamoyladenylate synthase